MWYPGRALTLRIHSQGLVSAAFISFSLLFSSRSFQHHRSPCPPINLRPTVMHKQQYQPQHLGFVKSFADELKLIFHIIPEVIRFRLVTFSGHKAPGMFYSLSVLIFETNTCNPFQGREKSVKFQPTIHRFLLFCFVQGSWKWPTSPQLLGSPP